MSSIVVDVNGNQSNISYGYDSNGRLNQVTKGSLTFTYKYLDQSPYTIETLEMKNNNNSIIHSKREFDNLMRTTKFSWINGGAQ
jgi:hypothetical protein